MILLLLFPVSLACGKEKLTSIIPLMVDSVATIRVNDHLVRTILYSTEKSPQLDIELIKTPEMTTLLDKKVIKKISVPVSDKPKVLDFTDSTAVSIDNIRVEKGIVKFDVEFFVRVGGGYYLSACEVDANKEWLPEPSCKLVKQGL